jgi:membrane-associated phospholipid phosphatase
MVVSLVYLPRVFMVYLFIGPALVVATVWGGFHYFYDALFGVLLGLVGAAVGIATARVMAYIPPASDSAYSTLFRYGPRKWQPARQPPPRASA